ncbi:MarR family winged helix-turn-helix transcriptional regulator [Pseudoalteromonas ruthenica]|uniref:MarR family winged helix-turn-helix transcriptional regulator n=1 Tax=Pseudoalteromonas ruthenica TaxID=151081 RepID=UPI001247C2A4|nr:MarR family transcriptional regulator [Pseudoalteromonas ruthenica]
MPFDLNNFIPYLLTLSGAKVSAAFASVYQDSLSTPQWRIMCHLRQQKSGLTSRQLCDYALLDKSTASRAINGLHAQLWVEVQPCAEDRRAKQVRLTPLGESLMDELEARALQWQQSLITELSAKEQALLKGCLQKLNRAAEASASRQA